MERNTESCSDSSDTSHMTAGDYSSSFETVQSPSELQKVTPSSNKSLTPSCSQRLSNTMEKDTDVEVGKEQSRERQTTVSSSQVCEESDGEDEEEEFVSASEGEGDDDDDDDQKLEEWAESLSTEVIQQSTQLFSKQTEEKVPAANGDSSTSITGNASSTSTSGVIFQKENSEVSCENESVKSGACDEEGKASEDDKELERILSEATCEAKEDGSQQEEDSDERTKGEGEKEVGDENTEEESAQKEEEEEEKRRKEEEDALTEEELQRRLLEAMKVKTEGNDIFRSGQYCQAKELYTQALQLCPLKFAHQRAVMLSNRAACHIREEYYETAVKDCSKCIELDPGYMKAYLKRADAHEKLEKLDEALKDHQKVVELDRSQVASFQACMRLEKEIQERNEKLKAEMLGKLKDLGNLVLRPFGLSTNNFQLQQDPNSGSYSVQFLQSPPSNGK